MNNMARETQKEKIERLEKELDNANNIIQKLNNEITEMIDKADESFENSSTYKQMAKQIETLEIKIKSITDTAEHNRKMYEHELKINEKLYMQNESLKEDYEKAKKENQKLINENSELKDNTNIHKIKNERGAGRKREITEEEREEIRKQRSTGKTIKELSNLFNRSVGIIHKIINEKGKCF